MERFLAVISQSRPSSPTVRATAEQLAGCLLSIHRQPTNRPKIYFTELNSGAVLRGSLVNLNEDVVDDTGEALALHAKRWNGHHAGDTAGMSHGR